MPRAIGFPSNLFPQQIQALTCALRHAEYAQLAALSRTPLAGIRASVPADYLTAWALLGTWTCKLVWTKPEGEPWPEACHPATRQLAQLAPYLGAWARSSFEQGALCALAATSSTECRFCALPGDSCFQCHGVWMPTLSPEGHIAAPSALLW